MCATRSLRSERSQNSERRKPASSSAWGRRRIPSENGPSTTARGRTEASRSPARPSITESTRFSTSTSMRGPSDGCGRSTAARARRTSWSRVTWLRTASASMCSSGSFGRAVCASIRTVELSMSEHDYYHDIRYNSMVSLNYSLSIPEGRVPSAVRNRHCEQHPPHALEGHRRCFPPVPHADRVHPERVRPEDGRLERAGFGALPAVRRMPPRPDGQGERERARNDPQGLPDPIRKSLESVELRRIERGDCYGELPQDGRPSREARGATEMRGLADEIASLTKGSRYRIESMETRERTKVTKGVFRGYATIGTDDAIVIELDESHQELKGKLRLIPLHVVLAVDVLEHVPGDAPKVEKHGTMYG